MQRVDGPRWIPLAQTPPYFCLTSQSGLSRARPRPPAAALRATTATPPRARFRRKLLHTNSSQSKDFTEPNQPIRDSGRKTAEPVRLCPAPGKPREAYWSGSVDLPNCTQSTQSIKIYKDRKTRRAVARAPPPSVPPKPSVRSDAQKLRTLGSPR